MARVIWTPQAQQHLKEIFEYMSEAAPAYAAPLIAGIAAATEPVALFPSSGRIVPEFNEARFREVIYEKYRIIYSLLLDDVYVLAVLHGASDVGTRFGNIIGEM